ncbi:hypothetical protein BUALT_Bualt05G0148300 [Buddleja alternifolia]|uniref:Myb/SANT-like domain-containing protein n=1 Tax=Buddleja alternifolia TaxID=168488 RepID=A0AAV6XS05_9LAMI|nr:hypothetical protein BUALT_Bualt05G0148300 [Buddleja alternifolia]
MEDVEDLGDDKLLWSSKEEDYLVELMVREVRKGNLSSTTFHKRIWTSISQKMHERFKKMFPMTKLKQKFNRFRAKWKLFKELIDSTGFGWDPDRKTVDATEEDWAKKIEVNKEYKQFRKKGCDHFELLCEIFNETVATGHLARSSTQGPMNSEEEQEVEEVFLHGTTKNPLFNDVEDISDSPVEKKSGPSKEEECVDILEKMEGITTMQFVNAIREFKNASIRIIFLRITSIHVSATSCIDKCFEGMGINRDDLPFYDTEEELDELLELQKLTSSATTNSQEKVPCRTSLLSGKEWVKELLEGHPTRIYENLRMDRRTFVKLCQVLCERHYLEDNTERRVSIEEVVAIFLYTVGNNQRQRVSVESNDPWFDDWDRDNLVDLDAESTADENNSEFVYYMSQQQLQEMTLVREEIAQHLWTDIGRG